MEHSNNKIRLTCSSCHAKYVIDISKASKQQLESSFVKCKKCGQKIPVPKLSLASTIDKETITTNNLESRSKLPLSSESPTKIEQEPEKINVWPQSSLSLNKQDDESEQDNWMALYGDMMSILLIFFILMFAISTIDKQKFQSVIEGISQSLGGSIQYQTLPQASDEQKAIMLPPPTPLEEKKINIQQVQELLNKLQTKVKNESESLSDLQLVLNELINENQLKNNLTVKNEQKGLVLIVQDISMFKSGSAEITSAIKPILLDIGQILSKLNIEIDVEGHTDDIPISTKEFASNWELSSKRATNVVHFFIEKCAMEPSLVSASGYAENRPRYSYLDEQASKNRRIEIVVKKKYDSELLHDFMDLNPQSATPQFIEY
ncbi:MAG: OmpA family protein [gamma proteobacterium symbiont of Taylorina sp.]|nr:OmpA family protein [gamma proteobacterium symbiont of Taylorina sp.]